VRILLLRRQLFKIYRVILLRKFFILEYRARLMPDNDKEYRQN